jgi:hypothetical protein
VAEALRGLGEGQAVSTHAFEHSPDPISAQTRADPCRVRAYVRGVPQLTPRALSLDDTPPARDALIAAVASRQHGLITTAQLAEAGVTGHAVAHRVKTGRLHRRHRGVYSVRHARLSQEGEWMAAVLAAGDGSALSHLSAAKLWNVWRRVVRGIDVVAPRRRHAKGVRVHACRRLDPRDVTVHRGIPVTTVPRTLVDLADVLTAHQLANVVHEAAFRNRFSARATRAGMERSNGRNLHPLEQALALNAAGSAGTKSDLEDRFLAQVQAAGLPAPLVNAAVQTRDRTYEVDFRWGDVCVEIDGPGHGRPRTRAEDAARDRALTEPGYRVIRQAVTPRPPPRPAADPRPP